MALKLSTSLYRHGAGFAPIPDPLPPAGALAAAGPSHWSDKAVRTFRHLMQAGSDPVFLGSMLAAQGVFGFSRLAFSRFLPQGLSLGRTLLAANGAAFALEGLAFVGSERGLNHAFHRPTSSDASFLKDLGHAYLTLGLLKGLGSITSQGLQGVYRGMAPEQLAWQDQLLLAGAPQAAAFSGIYLSQTLAPYLHLAAPMDPSDRLFQSAISLMQFGLAGSLLNSIPGYARAQHQLQQETGRVLQHRMQDIFQVFSKGGGPTPRAATVTAGTGLGVEGTAHDLQLPNIFRMELEGELPPEGKGPAPSEPGIRLPQPTNGASFLALVNHLKKNFPEVFGHISLPPENKIPKAYSRILSEIELARINSPERLKIAQSARDWVLDNFQFVHPDGRFTSLKEAMPGPLANLLYQETARIEEVIPPQQESGPGYRAIIRHKGVVYDSLEKINKWTQQQLREGKISPTVAEKIRFSTEEAYSDQARSEGRYGYFRIPPDPKTKQPPQVVLISGGAELAPLKFFVEAGARVLVVDRYPLGNKVEALQRGPGGLYQYQANLLTDIPQVTSAILTFAGEGKVHLGLYPYADGLVWLLSAASEAIYGSVWPKVKSTFTLRSPSVVAEIPSETGAVSDQRWSSQTLRNLGNLFRKNLAGKSNEHRVAQTIVSDQRLPYAVGNWLGKTIFSEARLGDDPEAPTYAPVGPISFTKSMSANKMILIALKAAHLFDVDVVFPYTSRDIQAFIYYDHFKDPRFQKSFFNPSDEPLPKVAYASWAMSDHADLGIFAQANSLASLVYPAGIAGIAGVDGRKKIAEGLKKQQAGTYIAPEDPAHLQKVLQKLKGPLAEAFADHVFGGAQVKQLYSGIAPAVRNSSDQWGLRLMDAWNQIPLLTETRGKFSQANKVFGGLLLTHMMRLKGPGDQVHLTIDAKGLLRSILLQKANGEGLEYRSTKQMPGDAKHIHFFEQIFHLGKAWNGQEQLKQVWKYDAKKGSLHSTGPTEINPEIVGEFIPLGTVSIEDPAWANFRGLFDHSPSQSLTFPLNLAVRRAFEEILRDAQGEDSYLQIDPMRSLLYSVRIERIAAPPDSKQNLNMTLMPSALWEIPQGQLLESEILITNETSEDQLRAIVEVLVHGNRTKQPISDKKLQDRTLAQSRRFFSEKIRVMEKSNLDQYGRDFDPNVLHQRAIVAQAAGFPNTPNPGAELMAEIEGLILSKASHFGLNQMQLKTLEARFDIDKPLLTGQEYEFESAFVDRKNTWMFQIFEPGTRKVQMEGNYTMEEGNVRTMPGEIPEPAMWQRMVSFQINHEFRPMPPPKDIRGYQKILLDLTQQLEAKVLQMGYRGRINIARSFSEMYEKLGDSKRAREVLLEKNLDGSFFSRFEPRKRDDNIVESVRTLSDLVRLWNYITL